MEHTIIFLILLGAGFLFKRIPSFPASTGKSLNLYIIYVALPGLILAKVPSLHITSQILIPVTIAWASVALSAAMVLAISRIMKWSDNLVGALLLMVPLGNTSFLGVPMVERFMGPEAIPHALLYDQFGSFMALSTYGAVGFAMELVLPRSETMPLVTGLAIKLLVNPLIMIGCCMLLGIGGFVTRVSILESAMPPMVTAGALASIAGFEPRLTSSMVGIGILVSFLTLPLIFYISGIC